MRSGEITKDGIWYAMGGQGKKKLVLLHGLGANSAVWNRMIPSIEHWWDGRWIAPDLRGHGRSRYSGPYGYGVFASDVASLLGEQPEGPTYIIGHSLGGVIGALLASRLYGVSVEALYAVSVKFGWTTEEIAKIQGMALRPAQTFSDKTRAIDRYLKVSGLHGLVEPDSEEANHGVVECEGGYKVAMHSAVYRSVEPQVRSIFSQIVTPFRLGAGNKDEMVSVDEMIALDADAFVFEGGGHNVHWERPDDVLRPFLEAVW